ncbi:M50 family metallopeptidase [Patescibacteria group bacterium]|nr:M50 family metallopeptidase [Patescibacteria group bacterium]
MSFLVYDLIFLGFFLTVSIIFLYKKKKNIKKDGLFYLYRANWGINLINRIGKKYQKTMKVLSYACITCGYMLMIGMFYLVYTLVKLYIFMPDAVKAIKVPPITPLVPYLPQIFNLEFLPPFYFTYWILILAVIAITHEMAHGILAAYNDVRIKKTGFGFFPFFLPIFLAAFVELDEKIMQKKKNFSQRAILSAGTFANVLTAILFGAILLIFSAMAFVPSGVIFDNYAMSFITIGGISSVNGIALNNPTYDSVLDNLEEDLNVLVFDEKEYLITRKMFEEQNEEGEEEILAYVSAPAIKANLSSIITEINDVPIYGWDSLTKELLKYSPGDKITITTLFQGGVKTTEIELGEHPNPELGGRAWLGITVPQAYSGNNILMKLMNPLSLTESGVYHESKLGDLGFFIYHLFWWVFLISISVALINMLPMGVFDGGRFFYLTVLSITKNEKLSKKMFSFSTKFFLLIALLLIILWGVSFFR